MATLHEHQGKGMLQIQNVKGLNPFYKQCCMPISSSCQQPIYTTCLAGLSYPRLLILISDCFVAAGCPCTPWCQIIIFLSLLLTDDPSLRDASSYTLRVATAVLAWLQHPELYFCSLARGDLISVTFPVLSSVESFQSVIWKWLQSCFPLGQ